MRAGLHLDRYARVVAVTDAPDQGGTCERFRPRYAVNLEILTPNGELDSAYPIYEAVPLPVPMGAGMEAGTYGFPEPGCLVIVGFAYGRPDHPVIRQVYPMGLSMPALRHGEQLWQQSAAVCQGVDPDGNWTRETDMTITDQSLQHVRRAVVAIDELAREIREIAEHSTESVGGVKIIKALGAMRLLSGGSLNLAAVDSLNLTTARDMRSVAAANRREATEGNHEAVVKGNRDFTTKGDATDTIKGDLTEQIDGNQAVDVGGNLTEATAGDHTVTILGKREETVTGQAQTQAAMINLLAPLIPYRFGIREPAANSAGIHGRSARCPARAGLSHPCRNRHNN